MTRKFVWSSIVVVCLFCIQLNAGITGFVSNPSSNSLDWFNAANAAGATINTDMNFDTHPTGSLQSGFYSGVTINYANIGSVEFGTGPAQANHDYSQSGEGTHTPSYFIRAYANSILTLTFDNAVMGAGLFTIDKWYGIDYGSEVIMTAYDSYDNVLGTFDSINLNFQPNNLYFMGLMSDAQNITKLTIQFDGVGSDIIGYDNVVYASAGCTSAVPAPGALLLSGLGTGVIGWFRKRTQR